MWAFTEPPNYGVSTNPTQGEHFVNDRVDRNDTLVREAGQNSNDARIPGGSPIELRFTLLRAETAPSPTALAPFIAELKPHLEASGMELDGVDFDRPSLLLVEDFGTQGLQGATDQDDGESLSLFWRNIGESHKGGTRGGRWGLGKTVFANSSRISTWFGLTLRNSDQRELLIGQVALKKHKLQNKTYQPHALFCASEPGHFEIPIEDTQKLIAFRSAFHLTRGKEPGLSIAIPFPHESITEKDLLKAAILHFFFPILRGRMIITVNGKKLQATTLSAIAAELDCPELRNMGAAITVAKEICSLPSTNCAPVDHPEQLNFPNGQLAADAFTPENLKSFKERYQKGELLGLKVPMTVQPKHGETLQTYITLFLKHLPLLQSGQDFYLRDGISVIEHRTFGDSEKCIGLLLADHESVSRFLGDAENPAHTAWNAKARGLESKYREPQKTVMFIRRALRQFYDLVAKEEGVQDPNALLDVFFVREDQAPYEPVPKPPVPVPPPPPPPPPPPKPRKVELARSPNGFIISPGKDLSDSDLPFFVKVRAAYEVRRGNPFSKYHRSDFQIEKEPIVVNADAKVVTDVVRSGNTLSFTAQSRAFEVKVSGFDLNRDLKLEIDNSNAEENDDSAI